MAVKPILLLGHPGLRVRCRRVTSFGKDLAALAGDLHDTLEEFRRVHGFGRAIAAPQIGVPQRVVVVGGDPPMVLVNPVLRSKSRARMTLWDDCFSFPGLVVRVRRHLTVRVDYRDAKGVARELTVTGPLSELLQHELDHLDGVLAVDRALDARSLMLRAEFDRQKLAPGAAL